MSQTIKQNVDSERERERRLSGKICFEDLIYNTEYYGSFFFSQIICSFVGYVTHVINDDFMGLIVAFNTLLQLT
jgi:hypothetical protein